MKVIGTNKGCLEKKPQVTSDILLDFPSKFPCIHCETKREFAPTSKVAKSFIPRTPSILVTMGL